MLVGGQARACWPWPGIGGLPPGRLGSDQVWGEGLRCSGRIEMDGGLTSDQHTVCGEAPIHFNRPEVPYFSKGGFGESLGRWI